MSIKETLDNWERVKAMAARNGLLVELGKDKDGYELVIIRDSNHFTLRRPSTLMGAINWLDGYETGLGDCRARRA